MMRGGESWEGIITLMNSEITYFNHIPTLQVDEFVPQEKYASMDRFIERMLSVEHLPWARPWLQAGDSGCELDTALGLVFSLEMGAREQGRSTREGAVPLLVCLP